MKEIFPGVTIDQDIQFGKAVIKGTRIPVEVIIGHIAAGDSVEAVMEEYRITKDDVLASFKYAAKIISEEMVIVR